MYGIGTYLYTSIFGPEKTLFVTEQELQEAKRNLRKTGHNVCYPDFFDWVEKNSDGTSYQYSPLMDMAASYGQLEILKWLHDNEMSEHTQYALNWAAYNGNVEIVGWLCENFDFDIDHALLWAQYSNNTKTVDYIVENTDLVMVDYEDEEVL